MVLVVYLGTRCQMSMEHPKVPVAVSTRSEPVTEVRKMDQASSLTNLIVTGSERVLTATGTLGFFSSRSPTW